MTSHRPGALDAWVALGPRGVAALLRRGLPVPPSGDRQVWGNDTTGLMRVLTDRAEGEADTAWPVPLASDFARYVRDGDRVTYESQVFGRQQRLTRAVVAAASTGQPAWLDRVADGVVMLCEQSTWCWPAHEHAHDRGRALPDVTDPCVDLGAGEALAHLAWTDHVLGAELEQRLPGIRERIRHEADVRVLDPFLARDDWWWLGFSRTVNNWNPWILGNILVGAIALVEDPGRRGAIVHRCLIAIGNFLETLPADGAIDEGMSYWWEGACRALEFFDILRHVTAGRLDAVQSLPSLRATIAFPRRMHLGDGWYVCVADSRPRLDGPLPWNALYRAARAVQDAESMAFAVAHRAGIGQRPEAMGLGRVLRLLTDAEWTRALPTTGERVQATVWLPSVQILVARMREDDARGLTMVVKGGTNGEEHNHNDVGSVSVALDGVPVLVDAGRTTYTAQTFGPGRYDIWAMQSQWHNVPLVAGSGQGVGGEFRAGDVAVALGETSVSFSGDLAGAYPVAGLRRWTRRATLDRVSGDVVIEDSWDLATVGVPSEIHYLLAGRDVGLVGPGRVSVATLAGARLALHVDGAGVRLHRHDLTDPLQREVWGPCLWRLDVQVPDVRAGAVTCRVTALGEGEVAG